MIEVGRAAHQLGHDGAILRSLAAPSLSTLIHLFGGNPAPLLPPSLPPSQIPPSYPSSHLWKWSHQKTNKLSRRCHPYARKPASQTVLSRMLPTLRATRPTPDGASAISRLVGEKPTYLRPGIVQEREGLWLYHYGHAWHEYPRPPPLVVCSQMTINRASNK